MGIKGWIVCFVLGYVISAPVFTMAQPNPDPAQKIWESVEALPPGELLAVKLKDGKKVKGRLSHVSDTGLTLARGNKTVETRREEVSQIYRVVPKSRKRHTFLGALVGFAAYAGVHAAVYRSEPAPTHPTDAALIPLSVGVGALVGYAIGGNAKKRMLIYDAEILTSLALPAEVITGHAEPRRPRPTRHPHPIPLPRPLR